MDTNPGLRVTSSTSKSSITVVSTVVSPTQGEDGANHNQNSDNWTTYVLIAAVSALVLLCGIIGTVVIRKRRANCASTNQSLFVAYDCVADSTLQSQTSDAASEASLIGLIGSQSSLAQSFSTNATMKPNQQDASYPPGTVIYTEVAVTDSVEPMFNGSHIVPTGLYTQIGSKRTPPLQRGMTELSQLSYITLGTDSEPSEEGNFLTSPQLLPPGKRRDGSRASTLSPVSLSAIMSDTPDSLESIAASMEAPAGPNTSKNNKNGSPTLNDKPQMKHRQYSEAPCPVATGTGDRSPERQRRLLTPKARPQANNSALRNGPKEDVYASSQTFVRGALSQKQVHHRIGTAELYYDVMPAVAETQPDSFYAGPWSLTNIKSRESTVSLRTFEDVTTFQPTILPSAPVTASASTPNELNVVPVLAKDRRLAAPDNDSPTPWSFVVPKRNGSKVSLRTQEDIAKFEPTILTEHEHVEGIREADYDQNLGSGLATSSPADAISDPWTLVSGQGSTTSLRTHEDVLAFEPLLLSRVRASPRPDDERWVLEI